MRTGGRLPKKARYDKQVAGVLIGLNGTLRIVERQVS